MKQSNFKRKRRKQKRRRGPKTFEQKLREFMRKSKERQKEIQNQYNRQRGVKHGRSKNTSDARQAE